MSDDLPVRDGRVGRRAPQRRASRGFSPRRALAALALLATAGLVWGAVASPVFGLKTITIEGADLTGDEAVQAALELPATPPNAFTVATDLLRERLLALPAVADAEVRVGLPGTLRVRVVEREPVFAWQRGETLLLVDRDGRVLADAKAPGASAAALAAGDLPAIVDRRSGADGPAIGTAIDPLELDVATRLLSLVPADVGSAAPGLRVRLDDEDGWTLVPTVKEPWVATFGFYGPELRPPTMVPEQVRLLRSLLVGREETIARAILAGAREGTFTEKAP